MEAPVPTGDLEGDTRRMHDFLRAGEALLGELPAKPDRSPAERQQADRLLDLGRRTRAAFMDRHAQAVYDRLTDGGDRFLRLPELLRLAADRFPTLVPTGHELEVERARPLALQDGREIDQAIFVRGVLRSERAGLHLMEAMLRPTARAVELLDVLHEHDAVDLGTVRLERHGVGGRVTLQNTDCLNAEDMRLLGDLETAIDLVSLDERMHVGVLRGGVMTHRKYEGRRVFCAGINLRALNEGRIPLVDFLLVRELGLVRKLQCGVLMPESGPFDLAHQKPWVAAVEAFAIGGGMQLLFAVDHVIAARDAYFSLPAAHEGIIPGVASLRLTRWLGSRLARRIVLGGERMTASDAVATLLCDQTVAPDAIDSAIDAAIESLDSPAVVANRRLLNLAEEPPDAFRLFLAEFAVVQALRVHSDDVAEKTARFSTSATLDRVRA